jgi:DUF1365 family protein
MHSCIFAGQVSHRRSDPEHAFRYRLFMMYLDLAELPELFADRWFWSTTRRAPARFQRANYMGDPNESLEASVRNLVETETGTRPRGPIRLLTHLTYFGYCFNPISIYYCFDQADSRVETIVAEVRNTPWGERHCYVLRDSENLGNEATRRFESTKQLHVSPFMDMNTRYSWLLTQPSDNLVVRIGSRYQEKATFGASLILRRQEITTRSLARALALYPFMTFKVTAAIYFQALRLRLKGCRFHPHPKKLSTTQASHD